MVTLPEPTEKWDASAFFREAEKIRNSDDPLFADFAAAMQKFALHPTIEALLTTGYQPYSWSQLLDEWPHVSETDPTKLAYARNRGDYTLRRYTRTTIGRYVHRHWPDLPDHIIRDLAIAKSNTFEFRILDDTRDIVAAVTFGPSSCMKWGADDVSESWYRAVANWWWHNSETADEYDEYEWWLEHPYAAYAPSLGWRLAIRCSADNPKYILGRALIHEEEKCFVRTYARRESDEDQSCDDDILRVWLESQGYKKLKYWPEGLKLRNLPHPHDRNYDHFLPYIDGSCNADRQVYVMDDDYIVISEGGNLLCNHTDGGYDTVEPYAACDECGVDIYDEDDAYTAYRGGDELTVCRDCHNDHYVEAYRYARGYTSICSVHVDDVVLVCNDRYFEEEWDINDLDPDFEVVKDDTYQYAASSCTTTNEDGVVVIIGEDHVHHANEAA